MEVEHKRKKANDGRKIKMGGFLAIILLVIYIPSAFHWFFGSHTIATGMVQVGSIEYSINSDAYIIRDEEVIKSPFKGTFIPSIGEGEKAPANYRIATVLNSQSKELLDELKQKDQKIINVQMQKNKNKNFFSEDIKKIDSEIGDQVKVVVDQVNNNNLSEVRNLRTKIDELIKKKATIIGNIGTPDAYMVSLNNEKQRLQQQIELNTRDIVTKDSGIVSYFIDGYENELNSKAIDELTPAYFEKIKTVEAERSNNRNAEIGKPFAKIIKNFKYNIVLVMEVKKADLFVTGKQVNIRINDIGKLIDGKVGYKSKEKGGKCIVALEVDKAISETAGMRKINIDLILNSYSGYKVPLSCLREIDPNNTRAKIMLVKAGIASTKEIVIIGKDSDYAIIDNEDKQDRNGMNLYDSYILDPKNIQEGQLIQNDM